MQHAVSSEVRDWWLDKEEKGGLGQRWGRSGAGAVEVLRAAVHAAGQVSCSMVSSRVSNSGPRRRAARTPTQQCPHPLPVSPRTRVNPHATTAPPPVLGCRTRPRHAHRSVTASGCGPRARMTSYRLPYTAASRTWAARMRAWACVGLGVCACVEEGWRLAASHVRLGVAAACLRNPRFPVLLGPFLFPASPSP